jgi:hypothetical protein
LRLSNEQTRRPDRPETDGEGSSTVDMAGV